MAKHLYDDESITGINIAPLVDVVLVLLIIFMATAPLIQHRLFNIDVPKVATSEPKATQTLNISVDPQKNIFLSEKKVTLEELESQLKTIFRADSDLHVSVEADQSVAYGTVAQVLDLVRSVGIKKLALEVRSKAQKISK